VLPAASAGAIFQARIPTEARVRQLVGPARVVEEVCRDQRQVDVPRLPDRLAVVERLEHGQLTGALLDDPGDPEQVLRALGARQPGPHRERSAGGSHGAVDVPRTGQCHLGEHLLGRGVDGLEGVLARVEGPVDEQPVRRRDVDDRA
jgi:hypothetical protein